MNDRILSNRSEVTLALQNGSSLKMAKESELQLTKKGFVFYKGRGLFTLKQEQLVEAPEVSFNSSNSQFELSVINNSLTHLDVVKGEVTVSSPHIQTFVPEIVKAREGLSFDKSKPAFNRREFNPQMSQK